MQIVKNIIKNVLYDESGFLPSYIGEMSPYIIYLHKQKRALSKNSLVSKTKLPPDYKTEIKQYWKGNFGIRVSTFGYKYFYAYVKEKNINYIPADIFFKYIVRRLNKFNLAKAYADKNIYNKLFTNIETPRTIIRNINGRFFDENYYVVTRNDAVRMIMNAVYEDKIIIKPSISSGGGKDVKLFDINKVQLTGSKLEKQIVNILGTYPKDYIIQYYFHQHRMLADIHPSSLNTLRIITFEMDGKIYVLACVLKMGNKYNYLDKMSMGGLSCGINEKGYLNDYAFRQDKQGFYYYHPQTNFEFKGKKIPNFEGILDSAKKMHKQIAPYFRFVSWDMALGKNNNPVLIEANLRNQGIGIPQINCGPIFGENTKEILTRIFNTN